MKVLKRGNIPVNKPKKIKCWNCKSELEYTKEDIMHDGRDGNYIVCPVCEEWMAVSKMSQSEY